MPWTSAVFDMYGKVSNGSGRPEEWGEGFCSLRGRKETNGGYWHGQKRESSPRRRGCASRREEWMVIGKSERERKVEVEVATRSGNHVRPLEPQSLQNTLSLSLSVVGVVHSRVSSQLGGAMPCALTFCCSSTAASRCCHPCPARPDCQLLSRVLPR